MKLLKAFSWERPKDLRTCIQNERYNYSKPTIDGAFQVTTRNVMLFSSFVSFA